MYPKIIIQTWLGNNSCWDREFSNKYHELVKFDINFILNACCNSKIPFVLINLLYKYKLKIFVEWRSLLQKC